MDRGWVCSNWPSIRGHPQLTENPRGAATQANFRTSCSNNQQPGSRTGPAGPLPVSCSTWKGAASKQKGVGGRGRGCSDTRPPGAGWEPPWQRKWNSN